MTFWDAVKRYIPWLLVKVPPALTVLFATVLLLAEDSRRIPVLADVPLVRIVLLLMTLPDTVVTRYMP